MEKQSNTIGNVFFITHKGEGGNPAIKLVVRDSQFPIIQFIDGTVAYKKGFIEGKNHILSPDRIAENIVYLLNGLAQTTGINESVFSQLIGAYGAVIDKRLPFSTIIKKVEMAIGEDDWI